MSELLAIDLGTLGAKVGLLSETGEALAFARHTYPLDRSSVDGRAEQDPKHWWHAVEQGVKDVLNTHAPRDLRAVCVGGQGPTLVLVDQAGTCVRPALSWMDTRANQIGAELARAVQTDRAAYSLVPRLLWVRDHEPRAFESARWALQAWDFIGYRLAGAGERAAASTQAGDVVWPTAWLEKTGLDASGLIPPPVDAGTVYATTGGAWADAACLPAGVPIVGGMNDGIGSIVGAAGSVVGRATDPGGAAGGFALCWDKPLSIPGVDCWPGLRAGTSILGGAFVAGGRALDWWAAIAEQDNLLQTLQQAGAAPAGAGGLVFLPFLAGERSPIWDADARGAFLGLTFSHTGAHMARAVVESTGYAMRLLIDPILSAGARIDELRVCGGQAQSPFWNQIKADVTGHTVAVPRLTEVALMGDAICAAMGAGLYPDVFSAGEEMVRVAHVLEPQASHRALYDTLFGVYREGYPSLKSLFGPLARASGPVS